MRRTNRIVPTYTGDVSGACSALFELGGMVVIHDPSGCNSTYNTHDETRWYDSDSLIFITGFVERDAVLGTDDKLIRDVVEAARELQPRFIALCNSPIPFISGTDFRAIARIIERACGITCFYVQTSGMHDYVVGAGNAFVALAERFVEERPKRACTLNILGATPLDLGIAGTDVPLRAFARQAGYEVASCWAMGSTLDELCRAAEAEVNLVVSATGLKLARHLRERFGTPYVVGMPISVDVEAERPSHPWLVELAHALDMAAEKDVCLWPCHTRGDDVRDESRCCLVGEPVQMGSLAAALGLDGFHGTTQVISPLETSRELLAADDLLVEGEEGVEEALREAASACMGPLRVVADGLYQPIIPAAAELVTIPSPVGRMPLAHQALSGRNGWKSAVDLATLDVRGLGCAARVC